MCFRCFNFDFSSNHTWIGLSSLSAFLTGGWRWIDGTPLSWSKWEMGEPTSDDNSCARMVASGNWADKSCFKNYHFICEESRFV